MESRLQCGGATSDVDDRVVYASVSLDGCSLSHRWLAAGLDVPGHYSPALQHGQTTTAVPANYKTDKIQNSHVIIFYNHVNACNNNNNSRALDKIHHMCTQYHCKVANACQQDYISKTECAKRKNYINYLRSHAAHYVLPAE